MLFVLSKQIAWLCETLEKRSTAMTGLMWYIECLYRYQSVGNTFLGWPL